MNNDNYAIAGFVLAIVSLFLGSWVGEVCGVVSLVFCILGLKSEHRGLAIAGLVIDCIGLVFLMLALVGCTALAGLGLLAML